MSITEAAASVAARAFFYPSLAWNIARNRLQETWHWWDVITDTVVLGALPFYSTLDQLKALGVTAVVTLNEEFEVFITPEQYQDSGFEHLHIPTVDFLYAPPIEDLHKGADFIEKNGASGGMTYVHCKAGRGRSTTLVLCYLTKYKKHTPEEAYKFVREKRPQVYLAQGQWTAVCAFYISCHPGKDLCIEDFAYPTFLPIATGKQGSDGSEPGLNSRAASEAAGDEITEDCSQDGREGGEDACEPRGAESETRSSFCDSPSTANDGVSASECGAETSSSAVRISASTQPADSDDVVILHGLGSERSDSEVSISNFATAFGTCCLDPRAGKRAAYGGGCDDERPEGLQPPERAASPAIQIPRGRSGEEPQAGNQATASSKGSVTFERSSSSKGSIQLEPSGSLPGYIRITSVGKRKTPTAPNGSSSHPVVETTFTSTGFSPIEDWATIADAKS